MGRIRGLLTSIHPALERVLGPRIAHPAVLEVLSRCGGPAGIRKAGKRKLTAIAVKHAPRMGARLATDILAALDEQTVVVPGTAAAETVLPKLADSLKGTLLQRKAVAEDVERALDEHPLSRVLTSMPGIGVFGSGPDPDRGRRRLSLPLRRPPGGLRRHRTGHPKIGLLDPW